MSTRDVPRTRDPSPRRQDRDANQRFYGRAHGSCELLLERLGGTPDPVPTWRAELARVVQ